MKCLFFNKVAISASASVDVSIQVPYWATKFSGKVFDNTGIALVSALWFIPWSVENANQDSLRDSNFFVENETLVGEKIVRLLITGNAVSTAPEVNILIYFQGDLKEA